MRQSIDDVDVLNLLQAAGGGARVSGAVLGLLVEGGNQPGAPEGGEMLGQHSAQSALSWDKTLPVLAVLLAHQRILTVFLADCQVETVLVINETQLSVNHLLKC